MKGQDPAERGHELSERPGASTRETGRSRARSSAPHRAYEGKALELFKRGKQKLRPRSLAACITRTLFLLGHPFGQHCPG